MQRGWALVAGAAFFVADCATSVPPAPQSAAPERTAHTSSPSSSEPPKVAQVDDAPLPDTLEEDKRLNDAYTSAWNEWSEDHRRGEEALLRVATTRARRGEKVERASGLVAMSRDGRWVAFVKGEEAFVLTREGSVVRHVDISWIHAPTHIYFVGDTSVLAIEGWNDGGWSANLAITAEDGVTRLKGLGGTRLP